jgi:hypothetical protein
MVSSARSSCLGYSLFCLLSFWLQATEREPWLGNLLEFEWRNQLSLQVYQQIQGQEHHFHYRSEDFLFSSSLGLAPQPEWAVEAEIRLAHTKKGSAFDSFALTGRYQWLDDVAGDPISLVSGLSLIQACSRSLHDVSLFHHGTEEVEGFLSIGKERTVGESWNSRWWGILGIGVANRGSPWMRLDLDYDYRFTEEQSFRVFAHSLWGLGGQSIHLAPFKGYGPVRHQSIDLGLRYVYELFLVGTIEIEYAYRVYARNFPANVQMVQANFFYTFGL